MKHAQHNSSLPLAEGNPPHLSTYTEQGCPPSPHSTKRLSSSSPTLSTTISPNMTSHNAIGCCGARRGRVGARLSFSAHIGFARRLVSGEFCFSRLEWIYVNWHHLMDADGGGSQCTGLRPFQKFCG
eukprot:scaffold5054_cov160-Isochrysis_galbana.AAC.1